MKKHFLLGAMVFLSFCTYYSKAGNYEIVRQQRNTADFDAIIVSDGLNAFISQGNEFSIEVVAEEKDIEIIRTEVRNGVLRIDREGRWQRSLNDSKIFITLPELKSVKSSEGSDVILETRFKVNNVEIESSGGADLTGEFDANEVYISVSGGADANISGSTAYLQANVSGGADLHAFNLIANTVKVTSSGGADADVNAVEEITANASGGGDISYEGNPKNKNFNKSGGGDIRRR